MNINKIKNQIDYWLAIYYDCLFAKKGIIVLGYTKSGTNWLRNLIRYYYEIDQPETSGFSRSFFRIRVHHFHRFVPLKYFKKRTIYMIRDGRDTLISRYFTMVRQQSQQLMKKDFIAFSGKVPTEENIKELLPDYINFLKTYSKSTIDYRSHILKAEKMNYFIIKYEDLRADTKNTFEKVLKFINKDEVIDENKVEKVIEESSISSSIKKKKKQSGFFRKNAGKSGGWKDYFNYKSAQNYNSYTGDILIKYGYEKDESWVNEFK